MSRPAPRWVQPLSAASRPTGIKLFCFPYAGGGASTFRDWARELPDELGVYAIQLPGRESRILETPIDELEIMLAALRPVIRPYLNAPFAFFGHSMGAVVSWELARSLRATWGIAPTHLFVSGCRALHHYQPWLTGVDRLSDTELAEKMRGLNGTPDEVFQDTDLLSLLLPSFRADLGLLAKYGYTPDEPLDCPATVFGGDCDPVVSPAELNAWAGLTTGDFQVRVLSGDHFFLHTARAELLAAIVGRLGLAS